MFMMNFNVKITVFFEKSYANNQAEDRRKIYTEEPIWGSRLLKAFLKQIESE